MSFSSNDFRDWVLLAEGGEAEVFRARQVSLDRLVAIKRLKYAALVNSGAIQRFGGEAKLSASLQHPCLVQVYDYGQQGPYWNIVMEYVDGIDFGKILHPRVGIPPLPVAFKLDLARQLVEVLNFLHSRYTAISNQKMSWWIGMAG
jgi:eukaryotic-like serine/threonine-protein kinase